ncbi:MAG: DUF1501 domain-containing protein [Chitinophagaceae bacterium]
MNRSDFLKKSLIGSTLIPSFINGFSVKAMGAEFALAAALNAPTILNDNVLVIIQLNGGNDGLNTVIPLEYFSNYVNARQNIFIPEDKVLALNPDKKVGLHPSMTGLETLYKKGQLKVIQAVGYPTPNFSHFRATDIWMSASDSNAYVNTGWAGRFLTNEYPNYPNGYPNASNPDPLAIQIGSIASLTLQGPAVNMGMSISNPSSFYSLVNNIQDPAPATPAGKELTFVRNMAKQTQAYANVVKDAANAVTKQNTYPTNNSLADQLKIVARLIKGGLKTKVYMVSYGGFDNHANQVNSTDKTTGVHATLLKNVSDAIKAFQDDLEFLKIDERVVGFTFSEFGRRIKSNASTGTDHGAAAPCFVFGKNVLGGVLGNNPIIPTTASVNDNIPFQYDFRSIYATLLTNWLCVDELALQQIMLKNFQQLPLLNSKGCNKPIPNFNGIELITNYPNPFTNTTTINFNTTGGHTLIQILNTSGQLVKTLLDANYASPGNYTIKFDSTNLPTGIYYARLQNLTHQAVKPMLKVQ